MKETPPRSREMAPIPDSIDQTSRFRRIIIGFTLGLALIAAAGRWFDGFEADDLQHLHAAWLVGQGRVPYRDYFDHHTPLYHVVFAPYASHIGRDPLLLMITFRILAAACACGIFYLFWRLIARLNGPIFAWLGLGLFAASRHSDLLFSLRPDYIAVLLLLAAITLLVESNARARYFAAGVCVGVGFGFTQKVLALAPAFLVWATIALFRIPRDERKGQLLSIAAIAAGMALPVSLMIGLLAREGALAGFLAGPIGFASHWTQPKSWVSFTQEPVLLEFGLSAMGFAWAFRSVWKWAKGKELPETDVLLGLLLLFGTAGLLKTPAPTQQAYMLTMSLWLHVCGIRCLIFLLARSATQESDSTIRRYLCGGAAVALILLTYYNMLAATIGWVLLFLVWSRGKESMRQKGLSTMWAFALLGFIPAAASIATSVDRILRNTAKPQIQAMRAIDRHVGETGAVLTTWPIYTPFRPHATFHWFSDAGMYTSMPLETLRREYLTALKDLNTTVAVVDRDAWEKYLPDVLRELDLRFREVVLPRGGLAGARAYVWRPAGLSKASRGG